MLILYPTVERYKLCGHKTCGTETLHRDAIKGVDNAMPCHRTGYGRHNIRAPATRIDTLKERKAGRQRKNMKRERKNARKRKVILRSRLLPLNTVWRRKVMAELVDYKSPIIYWLADCKPLTSD